MNRITQDGILIVGVAVAASTAVLAAAILRGGQTTPTAMNVARATVPTPHDTPSTGLHKLLAPADATEDSERDRWIPRLRRLTASSDYVAKVKVVSVGDVRANTVDGVPPTRAPGPWGSSLPSPEKDQFVVIVFDVIEGYKGLDGSNVPDGFVAIEYAGSVDDLGGWDAEVDTSPRRIDLSIIEPDDVGLLFAAERPQVYSNLGPISEYADDQTADLNRDGRQYIDNVDVVALFVYDYTIATIRGVFRTSPTKSVAIGALEGGIQGLLSTATSSPTLTATNSPTPTHTPTPTPVTFAALADAFVLSTNPTQNYGTQDVLNVRGSSSPYYRSYLKFDVSGLSGAVISANLRLWVTDQSNDYGSPFWASNNYYGTETSWTETGLTWNNQPISPGVYFPVQGPTNGYVDIDVTTAVAGNGTVSFGILGNVTDLAAFSSREATTAEHRPVLTIVTQ